MNNDQSYHKFGDKWVLNPTNAITDGIDVDWCSALLLEIEGDEIDTRDASLTWNSHEIRSGNHLPTNIKGSDHSTSVDTPLKSRPAKSPTLHAN